jgi:hypothetical protein
VHALYLLFDCPERLLRAGQSLIVMNNNARRSKCSYLYSSHTHTPMVLHNYRSSSTNGLRYISMSFPGCFGPWMSTGIIMNFRFMHSHRVTGQVLWLLLYSPKGFMPSVLKANHKFLVSSANFENSLSVDLHWDPSARCLNILSTLQSSLCHHSNFACSLFLNKCFKHGIIGAYHITLAGILFLRRSPTISPGSSRLILYRDAWHTGHASKFLYSLSW